MATVNKTLGARFKIEGEQEYKNVINQLNAGSKTLKSEMALLQAEYKGNANSIEFLSAKSELLGRALDQQKAKTEAARKMHEAASKAFAEAARDMAEAENGTAEAQAEAKERLAAADRELQKYTQQLNYAQAEEFNLQHQIDDTNDEIDAQGSLWGQFGESLEGIAGKLGIQIPDGAKKALSGMQGFSAGTVKALGASVAAVAALGKAISELHQMTLEVAADVDEIITESIVTGIDTQTYQALQYAENLVDVSVGTMSSSLTKLAQNMAAARDGNEELAASFASMGVEITNSDGSLRNSYDVMMELVDALGMMSAGTERDAVTMQLLGRSAQELNPLINAGSKALKEYGDQARATGYILDEQQIKKLGEVDDAYQEVQLTIAALKKQMAADFAPAAKAAMELFRDVVAKAGEMLKKSGLIENLATIIESLIHIFRTAGQILSGIPGFNAALTMLKVTLGAIAQFVSLIADVADVIAGLLTLDFHRVGVALGFGEKSGELSHWQTTYKSQNGTLDQYNEYYANKRGESTYAGYKYDVNTGRYYNERTGNYENPSFNAGGTDNWRGGLTWVGEAGPELVSLPRGSQISTAQESAEMGATVINVGTVSIDASSVQEFNDVVRILQGLRVQKRMAG